MTPVPFDGHTMLTAWQAGPFAWTSTAAAAAATIWYLRAERHLAQRGRRWPARRRLSFLTGLAAIVLALQSPVATLGAGHFQSLVVQHLLLMMASPALLAMGAPSTLLLQTTGRRAKSRWLRVLGSRPFSVITHPLTVGLMYFGAMFAFFLTPFLGYALDHAALFDAVNVFVLFGGCCYWWPMVGVDPIVHWRMTHGPRMALLLIGGPIETVIGLALLSQHAPVAPQYTVAGTQSGGGLLWGLTELASVAAFVPIFLQWMRSEERQGARDDARSDRAAAILATDPSPPGPGEVVAAPARAARPLTPWEAEWMARTGSVPAPTAAE